VRGLQASGVTAFPNIEREYNGETSAIFTTDQHKQLVLWAQVSTFTLHYVALCCVALRDVT
jgi:hypothetical protein